MTITERDKVKLRIILAEQKAICERRKAAREGRRLVKVQLFGNCPTCGKVFYDEASLEVHRRDCEQRADSLMDRYFSVGKK